MKYLIDIPDNWKELNDEEFIKSISTSLRNGVFIPDQIAKIMLKEKEQFIYSLSNITDLPGKKLLVALVDEDIYDEMLTYPDHRVYVV